MNVAKVKSRREIPPTYIPPFGCPYNYYTKLYFSLIGKGEVVLMPGDIYYFQRVKRVTIIHTVWGEYEIWDKLDDIYKKVSGMDFIRCHNSYIVYLPAIREKQKNTFILRTGTRIGISRGFAKATRITL